MKIVLALVIFLANFLHTQWHYINPYPNGADFKSVYFVSKSTGFISTSDGIILKTTDSGLSWHENEVTHVLSEINDICFINDSIGFSVGGFYSDRATYSIIN